MYRLFNTILSSLILLLCSMNLYAQDIPNAGFENWTSGSPDDWYTTNTNFLTLTFNVVNKETSNPHSGLASARLEVVTKTIPFVGSYTVPGVLTLSEITIDLVQGNFNISGGYPFTGMPQQLAGFLKYQPVGTDTAFFGFALSKWNDDGTRDTIGYAQDTITGAISSWTEFSLPIAYDIWEAPDTMSILFLCTNVNDPVMHTGTKLWVDDLSFIYGNVGIEGITFGNDYRIYADPITRQLILDTKFESPRKLDIALVNMSGQTLVKLQKTMISGREYLDIGQLAPGTYILQIIEGNKMLDSRKISILN
jgi:hypothetical protein